MTAPTLIQTADGTEINVAEGTCEGCGQPMADHTCGGASGGGSVTYSRSTGAGTKRAPASAGPACPHCSGRLHMNLTAAAVNAECLTRQYSLDTGAMTDPYGRLPVLTLEMMGEIVEWAKTLASPPTYGKMESAAGGASTYAAMRPKTGRKKKMAPAAPGAQIQDMAADETVEATDGEALTKPKKSGKGKGKGKTKIVPNPEMDALAEGDSGVLESPETVIYDDGSITITNPFADAEELAVVVPEPVAESVKVNDEEKARSDRAARRAERKKLLAGKV